MGLWHTGRIQQLHVDQGSITKVWCSSSASIPCWLRICNSSRSAKTLCFRVPRVGPGQYPLSLHFPTFYSYLLVSFTFPFSISYSLHLFSCFSVPSHSATIVSVRFEAGCRRRRLNLALVFMYWFCVICIFLVKDACFLSYLILFCLAVW